MTAAHVLAAARQLVETPAAATDGVWGRAAALLARQALEHEVAAVLKKRAPGSQATPFSVQLLVLREVLEDADLAASVAYAWSALSMATHHHGYELPPTAAALRGWIAVVERLLDARAHA